MKNYYIENAKWIWQNNVPQSDEYAEFYVEVPKGTSTAFICADSNYEMWVNGRLAAFGQYADYPYDKVYDRLELSEYFTEEENSVLIRVWYYGIADLQTYYIGKAGVKFAFFKDGKCMALSSKDTQSRLSPVYIQHQNKWMTSQIGFSFSYDANGDEGAHFGSSVEVELDTSFRERPVKKLILEKEAKGKEIKVLDDGSRLFDLGREEVGFIHLKCKADRAERVTVSWGEHIADGRVRRIIELRDFSLDYIAKAGGNDFTNYFRRLGCRYIEVKGDITDIEVGIIPAMYPLSEKPQPKMTAVQKKIFDACVRTLRLCMHEHYEDCPWREQALYAMDSRNQILCGYYAFGEYEFPRGCLELMAHDRHPDGFLSICPPSSNTLVIPSFSMHYITECCEYAEYSGDTAFIAEVYPKLCSILECFLKNIKDGVICSSEKYWNFYEWVPGLEDREAFIRSSDGVMEADIIINALGILSLERLAKYGNTERYTALAKEIRENARKLFYDGETVWNRACRDDASELGVSLAILADIVTGDDAVRLAKRLANSDFTHISLSMNCFKYDALLKVSDEYKAWILEDIERIYVPMLDGGTGTVWETEAGESDFANAGSLCHGWSAMPVYYYYKFLGE